jgi:hypothetical protein
MRRRKVVSFESRAVIRIVVRCVITGEQGTRQIWRVPDDQRINNAKKCLMTCQHWLTVSGGYQPTGQETGVFP